MICFEAANSQRVDLTFALSASQRDYLANQAEPTLQFKMIRDYRYELLGTLCHSAHLTLFYLMKYEYLNTTAYDTLRRSLALFLQDVKASGNSNPNLAEKHFSGWQNYIMPLPALNSWTRGTAEDGKFVIWQSIKGLAIGIGAIIRIQEDYFIVWLPAGEAECMNEYVNLSSGIPKFLLLRSAQFCRNQNGDGEIHVEPSATRFELIPHVSDEQERLGLE